MKEKKIKALIIDDEPLACKRIVTLLEEYDQVEVAAVCHNGMEAINEIKNKNPELIFLDIQMPEIDGFEVLRHIDTDSLPCVIFVTAYDEYALKAFEVHALDYLLKPFKKERFGEALARAQNTINREKATDFTNKVERLLVSLETSKDVLSRIMVESSGQYFFLDIDEVEWIESAGNYVEIHAGDRSYLIRETMVNMERKLDSNIFFRIHRTAIVNINFIKALEKWFHGDYKITLMNGEELTMSRNYKKLLKQFT